MPVYSSLSFLFNNLLMYEELYSLLSPLASDVILLSDIIVIVLSLFTGHIIIAPSVSLIVSFLLLSIIKKEKKELLFTGVNLKIGGIEKSLVNLVNKIDKDKYRVTNILEEKD